MLKTLNARPPLCGKHSSEMCLGMPAEPESVDHLAYGAELFEPFRAHLHQVLGSSVCAHRDLPAAHILEVPLSAQLRAAVPGGANSISWQRFCQFPLGVAVPHPTTLMKVTTRLVARRPSTAQVRHSKTLPDNGSSSTTRRIVGHSSAQRVARQRSRRSSLDHRGPTAIAR